MRVTFLKMSLMSQKKEGWGASNSIKCITHLVPFMTIIMYFSLLFYPYRIQIYKMQCLQF